MLRFMSAYYLNLGVNLIRVVTQKLQIENMADEECSRHYLASGNFKRNLLANVLDQPSFLIKGREDF